MAVDRYKQYNNYNPLLATPRLSGRSGDQNRSLDLQETSSQNFSNLIRNQAYVRMDQDTIVRANPPFTTGAAGRLLGSLTEGRAGNDPRISRGYIRRSVLDPSDPTSNARLYFMFNPEQISRDYVSYLDQAALDPFNTVFGANNLVAPPGVLDFSFDMLFDRQTENANGTMPRGVLEDFDYFDMVIRGVVPDPQMPALPDSGVLMTNPRNITVVFSPQLSVQGRPNTASVSYEKFDHQMRPIRMRITIGMKAMYIGPVRQDFTFSPAQEEGTFEATIPYENTIRATFVTETVQLVSTEPSSPYPNPYTGNPSSGGGIGTGRTGEYNVNQSYGRQSNGNWHPGIDFGSPTGTPVLAPVPLTIAYAGDNDASGVMAGYGVSVGAFTGDGLFLIFGHLQTPTVNVQDQVTTNQIIGISNNTGHSTGPHLHFEIRPSDTTNETIDPTPYIAGGWQVLG